MPTLNSPLLGRCGHAHRRPLELGIASAIVLIAMSVQITTQPGAIEQMRWAGVLSHLGGLRDRAVEHIAVHGDLAAPSDTHDVRPKDPYALHANGLELIAHSPNATDTNSTSIAPRLSLRPAIPAQQEAWTVLWLCGTNQPPAHWQAPTAQAGTPLPPTQLPFACR